MKAAQDRQAAEVRTIRVWCVDDWAPSSGETDVALKQLRYLLALTAFVAAAFAQPAVVVRAWSATAADHSLPTLDIFVDALANGDALALLWRDVPAILANAVIQQPAGDPGFVSSDRVCSHNSSRRRNWAPPVFWRTISWPALSSQRSNLARSSTSSTETDGHPLSLCGRPCRYQALQPMSPYSAFVNLADGRQLALQNSLSTSTGAVGLSSCRPA